MADTEYTVHDRENKAYRQMKAVDNGDGTFSQGVDLANVDVQNPLPTDGDRVYKKDVWVDESDIGDFSGVITDLVDNLHSVIVDNTANNPKALFIHFNSTIISNVIGLGAFAGNFSNTKITIVTSGNIEVVVVDDSTDNTKQTTQTYQLPVTAGFNAIKIEFYTADTVTLSNLVIPKTIGVVSRGQAVKPDGTVIDLNATAGGNQKFSLEELESGISVNSNSQLKTTQYRSDGTEVLTDDKTSALVGIEFEHHEIHEGDHYNYCDYQENNALNDTIDFILQAPNSAKEIHFTFEVYSNQGAKIDLYEGASGISGGTDITPRNNNRNSLNTSDLQQLKKDPTITTSGTKAAGFLAGAGRDAGFADRDKENILKTNEIYLLRITSLANSNNISWCAEWYEHTPDA